MFFERSRPAIVDNPMPQLMHPFQHRVLGVPLDADFPGSEVAYFAMGCFWGAEKLFWQTPGVLDTSVGYMGGSIRNPSYEQSCTGRTGHAETVRVVFDPSKVGYDELLRVFLENHDPTQGDRQGNDVGSHYRSAIWTTTPEQQEKAEKALADFGTKLGQVGYGAVTTTVEPAPEWYYAEDYHQQYLVANPGGYCPVHATGVTCG